VTLRLDASNLRALARGCALLSAGGWTDSDPVLEIALHAASERGPVDVVGLAALDDDALVMPCGLIGAPAVATERLWSGDEGDALAGAFEKLHGAPVAALMPLRIGGPHALLTFMWAGRLGLPVVDADGAGRGFPLIAQTAMHVAGIAASPVALADGRGSGVVVHAHGEAATERLARHAAAGLGGVCAAALFGMTAGVARAASVAGSLTHAVALGAGRASAPSLVIGEGRVGAVERQVVDGTLHASATVRGTGADKGREVRIEIRDQYVLVLEDGEPRAIVPDVIAVLSRETGDPLPADRLQSRDRVRVVALPAPRLWTSGPGLELAGPRAFGFDIAYGALAEAA
jgi:uncharacterized protein